MAISTKLQPYQPQPWDDPNAYAASDPNAYVQGDPNAIGTQQPTSTAYATTPTLGTPDSGKTAPTNPDGTSTGTAAPSSGSGGLPTIPDGAGGMVPVPPPPTINTGLPPGWAPAPQAPLERTDPWYQPDTQVHYNPPAPAAPADPASPSGSGGAFAGGMGSGGGSYAIDPNITGTGRGWDELNKMFDQGPIKSGPDPRLLKFQGLSDQALDKILNGPDRLGLAKSYYDIFDKETEGDYQRDLKNATNLGAARGRLGSGILSNTYGDLFERRASDKDATKQRLLTQALEGTIADRQNAYRAIADAENMAFGQGAALRNEDRAERDARLRMIDDWFRQQDAAYGREFGERKYADDVGYRGRQEERDDRKFAADEQDRALLNRINQKAMEDAERQREWDRAYRLWQAGLGPRPKGSPPSSTFSPTGV